MDLPVDNLKPNESQTQNVHIVSAYSDAHQQSENSHTEDPSWAIPGHKYFETKGFHDE